MLILAVVLAVFRSGMAEPAIGGPGTREPAPESIAPAEAGTVLSTVDGRTLALQSGQTVRLAAVVVDGTADRAETLLRNIAVGRPVRVHREQPDPDRHGRLVAHVVAEGGVWLQAALIEAGAARVYPADGETALAEALFRLERVARRERIGLWGDRTFRVRNPSETWDDRGQFQIVEGRVVDAAVVRGVGYLNFASDWRRDFTFALDRRALRAFTKAGVELGDLIGRRVRGRGWVRLRNGPMIDLGHPAQLELLSEN